MHNILTSSSSPSSSRSSYISPIGVFGYNGLYYIHPLNIPNLEHTGCLESSHVTVIIGTTTHNWTLVRSLVQSRVVSHILYYVRVCTKFFVPYWFRGRGCRRRTHLLFSLLLLLFWLHSTVCAVCER